MKKPGRHFFVRINWNWHTDPIEIYLALFLVLHLFATRLSFAQTQMSNT